MVRLKEIKDKLRPNQRFRNWQASHTFGGTTKTKSLYIAGFRRKNFYYVAAATGAVILMGGIGGGVSVRKSVNRAENRGQSEAAMGQLIVTDITESRTRTLTSDGIVVVTTEVSSFVTTVQRGAGTTQIQTTGADGKTIAVPGSITFVTNSDGIMVDRTLLGSTLFVTLTDGVTVPTTLYGVPTTFTDTSGNDITTTIFSELTVVTETNGKIFTSLRSQSSSIAAPITSDQTVSPTQIDELTTTKTNGAVSTGTTSMGKTRTTNSSITPGNTPVSSTSTRSTVLPSPSRSAPATATSTSSSTSTSLASSAGGSGGGRSALFEGEGTFYTPGLGSCGIDSTEADFVAALSKVLFDATGVANSNSNPYCGRKALVKAAGSNRLLNRAFVTQASTVGRVWHNGNVTLAAWERGQSMKQSRRSKINLDTERGQERLQENLLHQRPSTKRISAPITTLVVAAWHDSSSAPPQPFITPPPKTRNGNPEKRQAGGGGVTIAIVDRCPVCAQYDLDLSPAAFDIIGSQGDGRIAIEWSWLD